jgi:hypothetical protein
VILSQMVREGLVISHRPLPPVIGKVLKRANGIAGFLRKHDERRHERPPATNVNLPSRKP